MCTPVPKIRTPFGSDERFTRYLHESDIVWNIIVKSYVSEAETGFYHCAGNFANGELLNAIDLLMLQQYRIRLLAKSMGVLGETAGGSRAKELLVRDLAEDTKHEEVSALLTLCREAQKDPFELALPERTLPSIAARGPTTTTVPEPDSMAVVDPEQNVDKVKRLKKKQPKHSNTPVSAPHRSSRRSNLPSTSETVGN